MLRYASEHEQDLSLPASSLTVQTVDVHKKLSPLHHAAVNNYADAADWLIRHSASLEAKVITGETPLMLAAQFGSGEVVRTLVAARANVNHRLSTGVNVFHFAVKTEHNDIAAYLSAKGARPACGERSSCTKCRLLQKMSLRRLERMRAGIRQRIAVEVQRQAQA